jgi:cysteine desulfurase
MIYLDYNATTPVHADVLEAMLPYFSDKFANPSSRTHLLGREAEKIVSESRKIISDILKIESNYLIFTSGATEANNLAILGIKKYLKETGRTKIVTSAFEHKSVLDPINYLVEEEGFEVVHIKPNKDGFVTLEDFKSAIDEKTGLVSIMHVNNELGTVQPIQEIATFAKGQDCIVHVDGAQGFCKIAFDLGSSIDFYTASAHKIYGPKGIGCLFINGRKARKYIRPITFGGGQEGGLRPGTLPTPLIVGFAKATEVCRKLFSKKEKEGLEEIMNRLASEIEKIPEASLNTHPDKNLATTLNFKFDGIKSEALLLRLKELALSNGSACSTRDYKPSHVLQSIGLSDKESLESIRLSISPLQKVKADDILNSLKEFL